MAGKILIAHASPDAALNLEEVLFAAGCHVLRTENLDSAGQLLHQQPDLLLLDMQLAGMAAPEQLVTLAAQLELAGTFCLRLDSPGADPAKRQQLAPFACGTICPPGATEQILEQLGVLLRIKQAETDRNQAQESLLLYQMEVAEGLRSASQIQHALLPSHALDTETFSFAWQFIPCDTVGGDLFNILKLSEETLMAYMLDVSGHGASSAMVTVSVHQSLSGQSSQLVKQTIDQPPFYRIVSPAEVLTALDQEYPYERFEKFFTISYLLLEPETGRVRYCNGGHPPPLLVRNNDSLERLEVGGTLVGMGGLLAYEEAETTLQTGDRLYLYSDGITEREAPSGEMFGEQRLIDFFSRQQQVPLEETASRFIENVRKFGEEITPQDDISLLCIQFNGRKNT